MRGSGSRCRAAACPGSTWRTSGLLGSHGVFFHHDVTPEMRALGARGAGAGRRAASGRQAAQRDVGRRAAPGADCARARHASRGAAARRADRRARLRGAAAGSWRAWRGWRAPATTMMHRHPPRGRDHSRDQAGGAAVRGARRLRRLAGGGAHARSASAPIYGAPLDGGDTRTAATITCAVARPVSRAGPESRTLAVGRRSQ